MDIKDLPPGIKVIGNVLAVLNVIRKEGIPQEATFLGLRSDVKVTVKRADGRGFTESRQGPNPYRYTSGCTSLTGEEYRVYNRTRYGIFYTNGGNK